MRGINLLMAIKSPTEVERPGAPELETSPQRSGDWFRWLRKRIKLAFAGDDEELELANRTEISWRVYHNYHQLGILDAGEHRSFHLSKHGSLSACPCTEGDEVEYLLLPLNVRVHRVRIYRKRMAKDVEVYDMSVG